MGPSEVGGVEIPAGVGGGVTVNHRHGAVINVLVVYKYSTKSLHSQALLVLALPFFHFILSRRPEPALLIGRAT